MINSEDHKWREIARRLGPPGTTGLERSAIFDRGIFEHDADSLRREAERLRKAFERGDMLAPFECCYRWREAGLDPAMLPDWVLDCLLKIAADYYADGSEMTYADGSEVTPRALLDMPSKDRAKLLPSLDKVAGLRGKQHRPDAWSWRAEHDRDPYVADLLEALQHWAQEGGEPPKKNATKIERLARQDRYMTTDGREVSILDSHDRVRHEVMDDAGRAFNVAGHRGDSWNKSWTVRRRIRKIGSK